MGGAELFAVGADRHIRPRKSPLSTANFVTLSLRETGTPLSLRDISPHRGIY